ncbi:hypothetical protein DYB36_004366 [Aphanomyces astaci]|uniref:Protein kinase domain-containing protein n=1 Tax=Aphanomyces astaci TaxID=112090 RepID=A0A397B6L2_APHAT|nr:hypothetical protein DYB36_004366 [Aphanomyces astaci]
MSATSVRSFLDGLMKRYAPDPANMQSSPPLKKAPADLDVRTLASRPDLAPHWLAQLQKTRVTPLKGGVRPTASKVAILDDDRKVFLKCMDFTQARSHAKREFIDESVRIQALKHPHLVQVLGYSVVAYSTTFCVVLEFMELGTLRSCLRNPSFFHSQTAPSASNNTSPSPASAYQMCLDLAMGLRYLHSHRLPHGAISSSNVLVHANRQCKWNIQQLMQCQPRHYSSRRGHEGHRFGICDVVYVAPELLRCGTVEDLFAADIYALAVLFGEILTQKAPFADIYDALGPVGADVHIATIKADPTSTPEVLAPFSTTIWPTENALIMAKCLDPTPANRPTIDAVVVALTPLVEKPTHVLES